MKVGSWTSLSSALCGKEAVEEIQKSAYVPSSVAPLGDQQMTGNPAYFYERELVPAIFDTWAPVVVDFAPCNAGETVLDLACGTGAVTRVAAQRVGITGEVVALDINGAMLAMARTSISNRKDLSTVALNGTKGTRVLCRFLITASMSSIAPSDSTYSQTALHHCVRCIAFLKFAVGWRFPCGAISSAVPDSMSSLERWKDTSDLASIPRTPL